MAVAVEAEYVQESEATDPAVIFAALFLVDFIFNTTSNQYGYDCCCLTADYR